MTPLQKAIKDAVERALSDESVALDDVDRIIYEHVVTVFPTLRHLDELLYVLSKEQLKTTRKTGAIV